MKVIGTCFPDYIYPVNGEFCNTTIWRGYGVTWILDLVQLMNISLSEVEMVTELSPSNVTHPWIQTLVDGKADIVPAKAGITHSRYQFVDFSHSIEYIETRIFSKKQPKKLMGNFIYKTFDTPSFVMILISLVCISIAIWMFQNQRNNVSLSACAFYTFGNCLARGLPNVLQTDINGRQKIINGIHGLMIVVLCNTFSGTITASLLSNQVPKQIDSLWDIAKRPSLKIITARGTFWHEDLLNHPAIHLLKDRIEIRPLLKRNPSDMKKVLSDVFLGTHVLIGYGENTGHESTLAEMITFSDLYVDDQFHSSKPIMSRPAAFALPKSPSTTTKKISTGLSWLKAFGLFKKEHSGEFVQYHGNECRPQNANCPRPLSDEKSTNPVNRRGLQPLGVEQNRVVFGIEHLKMMFLLLAFGLCMSTLTFVAEIIKHNVLPIMKKSKRGEKYSANT